MTPWTIWSMEFSQPEYWVGLPWPPPGDLPNPEIKPRSPALRWILYQLSHKGSPRILEWVAVSFSRRFSQPRDQTQVSRITGGFVTSEPAGKPKWLVICKPGFENRSDSSLCYAVTCENIDSVSSNQNLPPKFSTH